MPVGDILSRLLGKPHIHPVFSNISCMRLSLQANLSLRAGSVISCKQLIMNYLTSLCFGTPSAIPVAK